MIEKSMNQIKGQENDGEKVITENENDMRLRSLRDANRGYSIHQPQSSSNDNHYLWRKNQPEDKYKSRFLPMRNVDPVRDDLAVRRLLKHTLKPTVSKMPPILNFAALSSNEEKARQNPIRISIFKTKRRNFAHCATKGRNIATSTASKS